MEAPSVDVAANPQSGNSFARVMGGSTNYEFKIKEAIFDALLNGKAQDPQIKQDILRQIQASGAPSDETTYDQLVARFAQGSERLMRGELIPVGEDRDMAKAQFFVQERRYIEAAKLFSSVLDMNPSRKHARTGLATCLYYLGNVDRSLQEIQIRIDELKNDFAGLVDGLKIDLFNALVLSGQAALGYPEVSSVQLEKSLENLKLYIELNPDSPMKAKVEETRDALLARKDSGSMDQNSSIMARDAKGVAGGGVMGGARAGNLPMSGASSGATMVSKLAKDATPTERQIAELADALSARDLARAKEIRSRMNIAEASKVKLGVLDGRIAVQEGRAAEGLRIFGEVLKSNPQEGSAWLYLGMAHMMTGDPAQAAQSWAKVREFDPQLFAEKRLGMRMRAAQQMAGGR